MARTRQKSTTEKQSAGTRTRSTAHTRTPKADTKTPPSPKRTRSTATGRSRSEKAKTASKAAAAPKAPAKAKPPAPSASPAVIEESLDELMSIEGLDAHEIVADDLLGAQQTSLEGDTASGRDTAARSRATSTAGEKPAAEESTVAKAPAVGRSGSRTAPGRRRTVQATESTREGEARNSTTGPGFSYRRRSIEPPRPRDGHQKRWGLVRLESGGCVNIVGESFFQLALAEITGREGWVEVAHRCTAVLVLEPSNPHDPHAIRVEIKGRIVGYLSRKDARDYEPYLRELAKRRKLPCCKALISGRGQGSATNNMGVFLYMSPAGPELLDTCSPVRVA
jgi:hypothetical protein